MSGRFDDQAASGVHPGAHEMAAWLDGTLDPGARDDLEAHLSVCEECRSGAALLRFGEGAEAEQVPAEMLRRARGLDEAPALVPRRRFALPAGIAAALVALAALALWLAGRTPAGRVPVERAGGPPAIVLLSPARGERVEAARLAFDWNPTEGADRYVVTLVDAGGSEVAALETGARSNHLAWPADRPAPPAGAYLWSVRALALDRVLAESRPVPFEIR